METLEDKIKYTKDEISFYKKHIKVLKSALKQLRKIDEADIIGHENMGFMNDTWYWTGFDVWCISLRNYHRLNKKCAINSMKDKIEMNQMYLNSEIKELEKLENLKYLEPCYFFND